MVVFFTVIFLVYISLQEENASSFSCIQSCPGFDALRQLTMYPGLLLFKRESSYSNAICPENPPFVYHATHKFWEKNPVKRPLFGCFSPDEFIIMELTYSRFCGCCILKDTISFIEKGLLLKRPPSATVCQGQKLCFIGLKFHVFLGLLTGFICSTVKIYVLLA